MAEQATYSVVYLRSVMVTLTKETVTQYTISARCQELSKTLSPDTDFIIMEHKLGYSLPEIHTKEEAIDRVVRILEKMSEERVREVLAYTEEKNELEIYQSVGRASRNDPVPVFGKEDKGKKM